MRVVHSLAPAGFGGSESVVQTLTTEQRRAGYHVHVLAVLDPSADVPRFLGTLPAAGVEVHLLRIGGRAYRTERSSVRDLLRGLRPDVLHTHGYRPDVLHSGVASALDIATVTTVHGFTGGGLRNRVYEWLQRRSYRRFDAVIAVSPAMIEHLARRGVPRERIHCVPNGWASATAFLPREDARRELQLAAQPCVAFIGRLSEEKGPDVFIDAVGLLQGRVQAVVIGDGPMRAELVARSAARGQPVTWAGVVPDAARLVKAFDAIVLSSRTEGTPIVLLEAMAGGTPIVATSVGGIPHAVGAAEALLTPPEDPQAIADAITEVLNDPESAAVRVEAAQARIVSDFNAAKWQMSHHRIYSSIRRGDR